MRRGILFLVVVMIQTLLFAGTAPAQEAGGFSDDFTYFDTVR